MTTEEVLEPLSFHFRLLRGLGAELGGPPTRGQRIRMAVMSVLLMVEHMSWLSSSWNSRHDMSAVTEAVGIGFEGLTVAMRFYALAGPGRAARLREIANNLAKAPYPTHRTALEKRMRLLTLGFIGSHLLALVMFTGLPWLGARDPVSGYPALPLPLKYPWDNNNPVGYGLSLAVQMVMMLLFSVTIPSVDCAFATLMAHASLCLRNVATDLRNLKEDNGEDENNGKDKAKSGNINSRVARLRQCAQDHQAALRIVSDVDEILSVSLGFQVLSSSLVFCSMAYHVTRGGASLQVVVGQTALLVPFVTQLFIFCLFGDGVRAQGEAVAQAAWESGWEEAPSSLRKDIQLVLLRAQKPTRITALYISDVSLYTFGEVMKLSYSYYNLLNEAERGESASAEE